MHRIAKYWKSFGRCIFCLWIVLSTQSSHATEVEAWMKAWMDDESLSLEGGLPRLARFTDPIYILLKPIGWRPNQDQDESIYPPVHVPCGFVTDLASIPPLFYQLLRPDGDFAYAAILHDYLYWSQHISREASDQIFMYVMQELKVDATKVSTIHGAVRLFGESSWSKNAELKESGEQRVLRTIPSSASIRWNEWKEKEGVFRVMESVDKCPKEETEQ